MEELMQTGSDIQYQPAPITFNGYEYYLGRAEQIAEYVKTIDVTEENIKDVKKQLADVRKVTDGLNKRRIDIKKAILAQYDVFEDQIKEISSVIDQADRDVRNKVRELEEIEREKKEIQIHDIWYSKIEDYSFVQHIEDCFHWFLTPQHLNKTTSLTSVEKDMTKWLEEHQQDWDVLEEMDVEYRAEYVNSLNLNTAISVVNNRAKLKNMINPAPLNQEYKAVFVVVGEKEAKLAEMILKENNINFYKEI